METQTKTGTAKRPAARRRVWLMRMLAVVFALVLAELLLQAACLLSPQINRAIAPAWRHDLLLQPVVPDDVLGHRGNPEAPGNDALGFRNQSVPGRADVVALGDSQTYGAGVEAGEAWPAQLAAISGRDVYNMGQSGWGPVQYRAIVGEALPLKPRQAVLALYLGNDVFDAYSATWQKDLAPDLRREDLAEAIESLNRSAPLKIAPLQTVSPKRPAANPAREFVSNHIKLYGLARALTKRVRPSTEVDPFLADENDDAGWEKMKQWAGRFPDAMQPLETESIQTIISPPRHLAAIDPEDTRIAAGVSITEACLAQIAEQCHTAGCRLLVVVVPCKEVVLAPLIEEADRSEALADLLTQEHVVRMGLIRFLASQNIPCVDALPALQTHSIDGAAPLYFSSLNSHLNAAGHRVVAELAAASLGDENE